MVGCLCPVVLTVTQYDRALEGHEKGVLAFCCTKRTVFAYSTYENFDRMSL